MKCWSNVDYATFILIKCVMHKKRGKSQCGDETDHEMVLIWRTKVLT